MKIGTVRVEEARVFDKYAGYHQFHGERAAQLPVVPEDLYGSFEIFWDDGDNGRNFDGDGQLVKPGWYWWACFPGCMPDGEPMGPFADSRQALQDADEWNPEFDEQHCRGLAFARTPFPCNVQE
jgi:hypothetical protein